MTFYFYLAIKGISAHELEQQNRQLRKELAYVKRQREILKKAMSIVSDESTGGML